MSAFPSLSLNPESAAPLYRQLADSIAKLIETGTINFEDRLPPTRELASQLGLNRTTVSAAYSVLEQAGLIQGHVGRGSFVAKRSTQNLKIKTDWESILPPLEPHSVSSTPVDVSFATSCPAGGEFPLEEFRRLAKQVIDGPNAGEILQLGSPNGYAPLRRYLLEEAINARVAGPSDDLIVTNGCQQALDLLARLFANSDAPVVLEDPVYHGLLRVFSRAGASVVPVAVDNDGINVTALEEIVLRRRPRAIFLTPSFQNPTGATLSLDRRKRLVNLAQRSGVVLVENDIYTELRYKGAPIPTLKELDESGNTILLRSYSKVSFPGLRVGWVVAPRPVIARLAEAKQLADLHSDHLSQAVLLRFAQSGELARHLEKTKTAGAERLNAVLRACESYLPAGSTFTRPEGGMSLWVEIPAPLTAEKLLTLVQERGVNFLPGSYFSSGRAHVRGLRVSFGSLTPDQITRGIKIMGEAATEELAAYAHMNTNFEPAAALV